MPTVEAFNPIQEVTHSTNATKQNTASPPEATSPIAAAVAPTTEVKQERVDPRILEYSRREKMLLQERRRLQQEKEELKQYDPWREAAQLAQTDKLKALQKLGITYDELTNQYLGQQNWTPEQIAAHKAQEVAEQKYKEFEQRQLEQTRQVQQQQYNQAIQQITADVKTIAETSQNYPLVKTLGAYENVTKRIEDTFHQTGRIMSTEEALRAEEQEMEEVAYELAQVEKIRNRFLSTQNMPRQPQSAIQQTQTLTHKQTTATPRNRPLTAEEKRLRAIDIFYGRVPSV